MEAPGILGQNYLMMIPDIVAVGEWLALLSAAVIVVLWYRHSRSKAYDLRKKEAYQTALTLLDRMIRKDTTNAMAYWQKGEVYEAMGSPDLALQYYRVAHDMCPRAYSYNEFSTAYDRLKDNLRRTSSTQRFAVKA